MSSQASLGDSGSVDSRLNLFFTRKRTSEKPTFYLSKDQIYDLFEAFQTFDNESKGWIEVSAIRVSFRALGFEPSKAELEKYMNMVDYNTTKRISFNDYVTIMTAKMTEKDSKEELIKTYRIMDETRSGKINEHVLRTVALQLNEELNMELLREMIQAADTNDDGRVTLEDFLAITSDMTLR